MGNPLEILKRKTKIFFTSFKYKPYTKVLSLFKTNKCSYFLISTKSIHCDPFSNRKSQPYGSFIYFFIKAGVLSPVYGRRPDQMTHTPPKSDHHHCLLQKTSPQYLCVKSERTYDARLNLCQTQ